MIGDAGPWPRLIAALAFVVASCGEPQSPAPRSQPAAEASRVALAPQTALLVVSVAPGGALAVDEIVTKPIPWTRPGVPWDPSRHAGSPDVPAAPTPALGPNPLTGAPSAAATAPPTSGVLVAADASGDPRLVVPLALSTGGSAGDVVDPYVDGGGLLWRAPWFGAGTTYRVVATAPGPPRLLATWP